MATFIQSSLYSKTLRLVSNCITTILPDKITLTHYRYEYFSQSVASKVSDEPVYTHVLITACVGPVNYW